MMVGRDTILGMRGGCGDEKKCIVVKNLIFTHSSQTKDERRERKKGKLWGNENLLSSQFDCSLADKNGHENAMDVISYNFSPTALL